MPSAYTNNGIFFPVIAHDGRICGNWIPWEKNLNISYFDSAEKICHLRSNGKYLMER